MVVPATPDGLHPMVVPALLLADLEVTVVPMLTQHDYWRALHRWWSDGEPFLIVEHDVVAGRELLEQMTGCGHAWCLSPYGATQLLGCTRFDPAQLGPLVVPATPWDRLDLVVHHELWSRGARPKLHRPTPAHLHGWQDRATALAL